MAKSEVNTAKLRTSAINLGELSTKFKQETAKLYETGQQLDKMWDGDAGTAFMSTFQKNQENFDQLSKLLATYGETLKGNVDTYIKAENDAKNIVAKGAARG